MRVMWTDHLPDHYQFKLSSRIGPIVVITDPVRATVGKPVC